MSSPSQRRRAQTLSRIADAALQLVHEGGIDALTMSRLADRVDYTAPALYRYVPSKGALIAELNRQVLQAHRQRLATAWKGESSPVRCLRLAAEQLVVHAEEQPAALALVSATLADPRRLVDDELPAHVPVLTALVGDVAGQIARGQAVGELRDGSAEERALRWLFGLIGTLQLGKLARFDPRLSPRTACLSLADDLLNAWSHGGAASEEER
jgi:AcrR family transcriptional regulator